MEGPYLIIISKKESTLHLVLRLRGGQWLIDWKNNMLKIKIISIKFLKLKNSIKFN